MYMWTFKVNGMQVCKYCTGTDFYNELEEYTEKQQKEIKKTLQIDFI